MINNKIQELIKSSIDVKSMILNDADLIESINKIVTFLSEKLKNGNQIFICGNGGSAADSLHIAAEFSGRFYKNRKALPVEALNINMAAITAISNDFGFEKVYSRMLESKAKTNDVLWVLSTSGSSKNIIEVAKKATEMKIDTIAFTGQKESELDSLSKHILKIPSLDTPRIQECHLMIGHIICELTENNLFNE